MSAYVTVKLTRLEAITAWEAMGFYRQDPQQDVVTVDAGRLRAAGRVKEKVSDALTGRAQEKGGS